MDTHSRAMTLFSRHHYIGERYKTWMTLKLCMLVIMGTIFLCVSFYGGIDSDIGSSYPEALEGIRHIKRGILASFMLHEGTMLLLVGTAVALFTIIMSHRIAGPLWKVERTVRAVAEGDLTSEIRFRKYDEIKIFAAQMNRMVAGLRTKTEDITTSYNSLTKDIDRLKLRLETGGYSNEEALEVTRNILDTSKDLLVKLNSIKTS